MNKMEINNTLCRAINIIAKRIVDRAPFDTTVLGTIASINLNKETYKVKVGDAFYTAKPIGGAEYEVNDRVYMLIPQNDRTQAKFILGKM